MKPKEVYDVLAKAGATELHHANTVITSCTFLEEGALLSRGYVEKHHLKQTPQDSDDIDKKYGIWNGVFLDHVDIHHRGGRVKGPNQYGPVLFVVDLDVLLKLPSGTDVRVTRSNPIHWTSKQKDDERWYLTAADLSKDITYGDFDKMLVINTPTLKLDFPNRRVRIALDDPERNLANGANAYRHARERLTVAAQKGRVAVDIAPHQCRDDCSCITKYAGYSSTYFDARFA